MRDKKVRAWIMYDWANSAFATTIIAAVLPIFYNTVAGSGLEGNQASTYWGYTLSIGMFIAALLAPVLGAVADISGRKMHFLRIFAYTGMLATMLFVLIGEGDWLLASILMIIATVGFSGSNTFYDALLTDLVPPDRRDYISAKGYAFGYIGGGILLAFNMAWIQFPSFFLIPDTLTATRITFASVAIWWFLFSLPLFRGVKDQPSARTIPIARYASTGFKQVWSTLRGLKQYPELLKYMIAFWLFSDGISTIIKMATIYGSEIGIATGDLILALLITQFVGIPCTLLFGKIADRLGSKSSLYISLSIYILIVTLGYFMENAWHFYALAFTVGLVQGGSQAIARSLFSNLIPGKQSAEFFGFLAISSRFVAILGPLVFAVVGQLTGSSRLAILSLIVFFAAGILMLITVNLEKGKRQAGLSAGATEQGSPTVSG